MVAAGARQAVQAAESARLNRWLWPRSKSPAFDIQSQIRAASDKAAAALAALKPGYTPQDLASALNLEILNFDTGSAQLPAYSMPFLNKAAEVIKMGPGGMVIEVGVTRTTLETLWQAFLFLNSGRMPSRITWPSREFQLANSRRKGMGIRARSPRTIRKKGVFAIGESSFRLARLSDCTLRQREPVSAAVFSRPQYRFLRTADPSTDASQ